MLSVVPAWFGCFLVDDGRVVRALPAPSEPEALAERMRLRREGRLTPEEEQLLQDPSSATWRTRDRRVAQRGVRYDPYAPIELPPTVVRPDPSVLAAALALEGVRALTSAWDPSVHVEEAIRAASELDRIRNLLGERLGSWVSRDFPDIDPGDHARAVNAATEGTPRPELAPTDRTVVEARRRLGALYQEVVATRKSLETAVTSSAPSRTPNLVALLGPELAARMVAQAGGLDRLARMPSSTVQVLGAERAFFEHLRGHAPPPRHGLLFLYPAIQSAPRNERGKLARALAGKVAIAARMDHEGSAVDPSLSAGFEARRDALRARRSRPRSKTGSGLPLDRAASDR